MPLINFKNLKEKLSQRARDFSAKDFFLIFKKQTDGSSLVDWKSS